MPLHLLSKKSWNVYAPDNIARVKRDEAAAAAAEKEEDRRLQEHDTASRLSILRREDPAPYFSLPRGTRQDEKRTIDSGPGTDRKRRRVAGEDDTERDLRLARQALDDRQTISTRASKCAKINDAPIADHKGYINLFPIAPEQHARQHKIMDVEAEKLSNQREMVDQYRVRLSDVAGRNELTKNPWYASVGAKLIGRSTKDGESADASFQDLPSHAEEKNAWGRADPTRPTRNRARLESCDPLAFMNKAETQLRQVDFDRKKWREARYMEMERLETGTARKESERKKEKREKRSRRNRDVPNVDICSSDRACEKRSTRDGSIDRQGREEQNDLK